MFSVYVRAAIITALIGLSGSVQANDFFPAPFRGQPGSVYAYWDFSRPDNPALPEQWNIVPLENYPVFPVLLSADPTNMVYYSDGAINGWISLPGETSILNFNIPNFVDFEPVKKLWIQVGYFTLSDPEAYPFVAAIEANDNEVGFVLGELTGFFNIPSLGYRLETWEIRPNPDFELVQFIVPPWILMDRVVIDTISVPEASTWVMGSLVSMGLAGAGLVRRIARRGRPLAC